MNSISSPCGSLSHASLNFLVGQIEDQHQPADCNVSGTCSSGTQGTPHVNAFRLAHFPGTEQLVPTRIGLVCMASELEGWLHRGSPCLDPRGLSLCNITAKIELLKSISFLRSSVSVDLCGLRPANTRGLVQVQHSQRGWVKLSFDDDHRR